MRLNNLQAPKNTFKSQNKIKTTKAIKKHNKRFFYFFFSFHMQIPTEGVRKFVTEATGNKSTQTMENKKKLNFYCL